MIRRAYSLLGVSMLALVLSPDFSHGQAPGPLVTDRPGQSESIVSLAPGLIQVELGWIFAQEEEGTRTHTVPVTSVRFGLATNLEGRVGFSGWNNVEGNFRGKGGFGDTNLGLRYYLAEESGTRPEMAVLATLTLPTGESGFSSERADPALRLIFGNTLGERLSLGYNLAVQWVTVDAGSGNLETRADLLYTASLGVTLSDRIGAFTELFGGLPLSETSVDHHGLDGGFTYLLSNSVQIDASFGVGLNDAATDWFVDAGFSFRLPR